VERRKWCSCLKVVACLIARKCWSLVFAPFKLGWVNALLEMEVCAGLIVQKLLQTLPYA
jgi:F0F1-type ATP synthase assembly protein I